MKYNYEDYLFLCARINARTSNLITKERCEIAAEAQTEEELFSQLSEFGVTSDAASEDISELPEQRFDREFSEVLANVPDPELFAVFTYPCDCHNLKSAVKCEIKGVSAEPLLIPRGSVPVQGMCELLRKRDLSAFPECMAAAAKTALEEYAKNRDPQIVDILIDSACFEDMKRTVDKKMIEYFKELLALKADTTNILTCVRMIKSSQADGKELMKRAFAVGGKLDVSLFTDAISKEEDRESSLAGALQAKEYGKISARLNRSFSEIGEACERKYLDTALNTGSVVAGAETVARYLTLLELEAKNLRCLITGKRLGYSKEKILGMLCEVR